MPLQLGPHPSRSGSRGDCCRCQCRLCRACPSCNGCNTGRCRETSRRAAPAGAGHRRDCSWRTGLADCAPRRSPGQLEPRVIVGPIPVAAPLPDVAGHVVKPVAVRRKLPDRRDARKTILARVLAPETGLRKCSPSICRRASIHRPTHTFCRSEPPRAANSHSASVGSRLPAHFA